jgi:hypothetical protein
VIALQGCVSFFQNHKAESAVCGVPYGLYTCRFLESHDSLRKRSNLQKLPEESNMEMETQRYKGVEDAEQSAQNNPFGVLLIDRWKGFISSRLIMKRS